MLDHTFSIGAVVRNGLRMEPDHFRRELPRERALALFREYVELVEVETTSYCNRTCSFCPNQFIDRRSEKNAMPEHTWQAILAGLREVEYDGTFVWSRYSEPLSERRILDRIREVRDAAPRTRITVNSNGDYLDANYLEQLADAGLDRIWVDIYIPDTEVYDLDVAHTWHERFLKRIGKTARVLDTEPELHTRVLYDRIEMTIHVRNVAVMRKVDMSDRGGLVKLARKTSRISPCYAPFKHLVIDYDGSVVVCCHLRSDSPAHASAVVGRIGDDVDLFEAYARLADWRQTLQGFGPKMGPCAGCTASEYRSNPVTRAVSRMLSDGSPVAGPLRAMARPILGKKKRW